MARESDRVDTTKLLRDPGAGALTLLVIAADAPIVVPLVAGRAVTIGRAAGADVVVDDESLSRLHATFRLHDDQLEVEDLGSSNGTLVGGERLQAKAPRALAIGDSLRLGAVLVVVQLRTGNLAERLRPAATAVPRDELIERIAASSISVLILGETGVGKEVMADRLHALGARRDRPLIKLHCAALMTSVLEAELFGYERGAFTGAIKDKPGLIEAADGGTLFLDEIGEADPNVQVKLLRVLEARETQRIGALRPRIVDVRFIAATHRNPAEQLGAGTLRADMYYRLAGFTITIPPLRERRAEIPRLVAHLIERHTAGRSISADAMSALTRHDWPGNVRELRNVLERAAVLAERPRIERAEIEEALQLEPRTAAPSAPAPAVDDPERARVLAVLDECGGNQTMAAERLGMSRRTLVYRLHAWGMTRPRRR